MSTLFVPLHVPRHASALFWAVTAGMFAAAAVFERLGKPRSTTAWMVLGYVAGMLYARAEWGGLVGAVVGALLGLVC